MIESVEEKYGTNYGHIVENGTSFGVEGGFGPPINNLFIFIYKLENIFYFSFFFSIKMVCEGFK